MDTVRSRRHLLFGQLPAVLPLQRSNQPPHIRERRLPRLLPIEPVHKPLMHRAQFTSPRPPIGKVPTHNQTNDLRWPTVTEKNRCSTRACCESGSWSCDDQALWGVVI